MKRKSFGSLGFPKLFLIPILVWRHAGVFFEESEEVIFGSKSQSVADFLYGRVGIGKQLIDDFQLTAGNVIRQGFSRVLLVHIAKVVDRQPDLFGNHDHGQVGVVYIVCNKALYLADEFIFCVAVQLDLRERLNIIAAAASELLFVFG